MPIFGHSEGGCMLGEPHTPYTQIVILINPIDPNLAVAARVVCPQSGRSPPEKRPFFHIFPPKSTNRIYKSNISN